jgi:hypothetical protein
MATKNPTPKVNSTYGAPMGRHTGPNYLEVTAGRLTLRRIRINAGGYDSGGAYWGLGQPLWYVEDVDGNSQFIRARDREAAKAHIREAWGPSAKFYR